MAAWKADEEIACRLEAIAPILQDQLLGRNSSGSSRALRNVASHNFEVSFVDLKTGQANSSYKKNFLQGDQVLFDRVDAILAGFSCPLVEEIDIENELLCAAVLRLHGLVTRVKDVLLAGGASVLTPLASLGDVGSLDATAFVPPLPFSGVNKHAIVQVQMSAERFQIHFADVVQHFLQQHDEVHFFVQNPHLLGDLDAELCYKEYYGFINFLLELCNCPCKFLMVNLADLRRWLGPENFDIAIVLMNGKFKMPLLAIMDQMYPFDF